MMSGDGLVVRIRPREGRVSSVQLSEIARLSTSYGNGLIDFSNRANIQLRGVSVESHGALIEGLRAINLVDADAQSEGRRNIIVSPLWSDGDGTRRVTQHLTAMLEAADDLALPAKFGFAVDLAGAPVLGDVASDIRIERDGNDALIRPDGSQNAMRVPVEKAAETALRLAYWFVMTGGVIDGRGRMRAHLRRSDVTLPSAFSHVTTPWDKTPVPRVGLHELGSFIAFEFGQVDANTLSNLAEYADYVRITPWHMVLLEDQLDLPELANIITNPTDPMLRVVACTGAPGCPQGHQTTRDLARDLAPFVPLGKTLHVSGCAKGCARARECDRVLVGQATGFDLVKHGRASDTPVTTGISADALRSDLDIWGN
jgi:precorrin-3B synthase